MKVIALVLALIAVAAAAPPLVHYGGEQPVSKEAKYAKIVRYESEPSVASDGYRYAIETSDGIAKEEQGILENAGTKEESLKVVGRYLYPGGPNGEIITLEYVADKNGFQPIGAHLPKPLNGLVN